MRRTYKPLFWRATRPVNTADSMNEWRYFIKYNVNILIIIRFKQYLPAIIQSVEFTGRVARQNNGLYVLRMIVKLAYSACLSRSNQASWPPVEADCALAHPPPSPAVPRSGPSPAQKRSKSPSRRRIAPVEQREAPITRVS